MKLIHLRFLTAVVAIFLFVFLASRADFVTPNLASQQKSSDTKAKTENSSSASTPDRISSSDLAQRINEQIERSEFASARWGISVISLSDGASLYQRDADKLFTPASNMKVYTTGIALDLLGPDYRWRTSVYASAQPDPAGTVQGDLILYGRGAPDLVLNNKDLSEGSLTKLVDDLYARGVRRIAGNVIGDESYFRGSALGDGWQWTDIQWYFGAEASALSINENQIDVNVIPSSKSSTPPDVKTNDPTGLVTIENRMSEKSSPVRPTIGLYRGLSDNNVQVWGEFAPATKGFGARLSVHNPALWAARLLFDALKKKGIAVEGQAQARNSRVPRDQRFDPSRNVELAFVSSKPLSEIVRTTNKESNNLYAELILRTLGRERRAMLELPEPPGRELGDDEAGLAVMRLWLSRAGIATAQLALHDGSGLSRLDLVTPDATAKSLLAFSKTASASVFRESLPNAGKDGTLGGRLTALSDRVSAKTGSLTYDNSLSGYLTTSDGKHFAFSILCNDQTGPGNSIRMIDQIVTMLASFPEIAPERAQKSQ
ncbi:MAG: D-alanyl-D-alanine carboxypeptidase/D-alanyl-D-alanine-endopeptidase [Acidobacteriota bacterium]|nr:D-alanyl-D-alanine carboxypeptidase/D-alanyl-D-alanine-endopeptidase [Acidobacteriota bacterium]